VTGYTVPMIRAVLRTLLASARWLVGAISYPRMACGVCADCAQRCS
jgi:hypothetical protein